MAKFLNHEQLNEAIFKLFEEAERGLTIVSPFVKLHPRLKQILDKRKDDSNFFIEILYGKNIEKVEKSMSQDDLDYFKGFRNVEIRYNEHLHAKYYANDFSSIITSLNLYQYSIDNNIESGVLFESGWLSREGRTDREAFEYFGKIIGESKVVFSKDIKEQKVFFGLFTRDDGSEVVADNTEEFYGNKGYCIRTGVEIPFNPERPFSPEAFKSWNKFKNKGFKEKYCHYSGEESNGETSFERPILKKNWSNAQKFMN